MSKKRRPRVPRQETLIRRVEITAVSARLGLSPGEETGQGIPIEDSASLELTGILDEPLRDVRDVQFTLYSASEDTPTAGKQPVPWIGLVHGFRPVVRPTVFVPGRAARKVGQYAAQKVRHLRAVHSMRFLVGDRSADRSSVFVLSV